MGHPCFFGLGKADSGKCKYNGNGKYNSNGKYNGYGKYNSEVRGFFVCCRAARSYTRGRPLV